MALLTQKVIMTTFEEMLEEMPFDKITVSALVKRCEISSNTFYYHYQDIYALLKVWLEHKFGHFQDDFGVNGNWKSGAKKILHTCQEHPKIVYHIFDCLSREYMERFIFESTDDDLSKLIRQRTEGTALSEERIDGIVQFCKFAFMGFFLKFLWNKMESNVDEDVDRLGSKLENLILGEIASASK